MKTLVPMLTIKKLVNALEAIAIESKSANPAVGTIQVIASETLKEVIPEIAIISEEAMKYGA